MAHELYVRELRISPRIAAKILRRGIHEDEARATVEGRWPFRWMYDPGQGWRAIVKASIRDAEYFVVLYPATGEDGEVWRLGSIYPDETTDTPN